MIRVAQEYLPQERQEQILAVLRRDGRVVAQELAVFFGVSEDSIRRDLREMAANGLCRRVYGGALLPRPGIMSLTERMAGPNEAQTILAGYAAELVQPGQMVLLDAASTNVEIARALRGKSMTVVTNSPAVAVEVAGVPDTNLVLIGGKVDARSGGATGSEALSQLELIYPKTCIVGACAIDPETGIWGMDSEESTFKRAMIRASESVVIVATDDIIGARGNFHIARLEEVDHLVISSAVPPEVVARLASHQAQVHCVKTK